MRAYLERVRRGRLWVGRPPACRHCGDRAIGWGHYERRVRLGDLVDAVQAFPVKRWRCTACERTFSHLPPFVLVLKRYAAEVVQGVWEDRVERAPATSLERLAESWGLPCVATLRRWVGPVRDAAFELESELRRMLPLGTDVHQTCRSARILSLARLYTLTAHHLLDRHRVPYHFVLALASRLR